jgi:hypothetical protein
MKKSKILASIPQNLMIYHIKNLCHHIEHISFYFWLVYGEIWTNIVNHVESFSTKLHKETWFLIPLSRHLRACLDHPNHKNCHHFNQEVCDYLMVKENLPNKLFHKHNGHSKWCHDNDFGARHSFCVPTMNVPNTNMQNSFLVH